MYSALADVVVVIHFAFIVFVALGAILAWRWPWLRWPHVAAVAWAAGIVTVGYECPLTPVERWLRRRAGEEAVPGGFVDHYIEGVIYPERYTGLLRGLVAVLIVVGWARLVLRRPDQPHVVLPRDFAERHDAFGERAHRLDEFT